MLWLWSLHPVANWQCRSGLWLLRHSSVKWAIERGQKSTLFQATLACAPPNHSCPWLMEVEIDSCLGSLVESSSYVGESPFLHCVTWTQEAFQKKIRPSNSNPVPAECLVNIFASLLSLFLALPPYSPSTRFSLKFLQCVFHQNVMWFLLFF